MGGFILPKLNLLGWNRMLARSLKAINYYKFSRLVPALKLVFDEKRVDKWFPKDLIARKIAAQAQVVEAIEILRRGIKTYDEEIKNDENITEEFFARYTPEQIMKFAEKLYKNTDEPYHIERTVEIWKQLAARGHAEASFSYATCLRDGIGIEKNLEKSFEIMLILANNYQNGQAHVSYASHRYNVC